ncbi:MAG: PD-(D/E)XK nuclease family protein [Bdellovibrionales bacterium]|jgi:RecB family exonuclease|nr:PD-(D/E)XK nuclease family protein [Bdellovibrionales bacterium]
MPGLHVVYLKKSRDRETILQNFNGRSGDVDATWVVSDVRSKLAIQRRLLEQGGFVEGMAVLRASELWKHAIRKVEPSLQIVSRELILAAISTRLRHRDEAWLRAPGAGKTAFEYIRQLMPILSSSGDQWFQEWLEDEENAASKKRWGPWYLVARELWQSLRESRLMASSWVPGALIVHRETLAKEINRALYIDLGAELSHVEADLLLEIARENDVTVFRPSPEWESDYPESRLAVDWMLHQAEARGVHVHSKTQESRDGETQVLSPVYKRLPSAAAEVKEAVARVRGWLEAGVSAHRIGIAAPDLESYWPVLALHLETEGIPAGKAVMSSLHSFSDVMRWLARLRVRSGLPESRDLEVDLFGEASPPISFGTFREVFSRVYERSDLELSPELLKFFENRYQDRGRWDDEPLSRDEFLAKALVLLREGDEVNRAIRLFKAVLEECPPDVVFESTEWVKYLAEMAARTEIPVIPADPFGVACLNLASLEGVECSHVVIMGLHEGALRSQHGTALHTFDLRSIEKNMGLVIDGEDRKRTEFEARWILSQPREETHLLFADTDLTGTVQTPSWSWISGAWAIARRTPEIEIPIETRFDQLKSKMEIGSEQQRLRLKREQGEAEQPNFAARKVQSLSATTVDQVSKCGLRFAFDRILGPRDLGELDLDADRSRQGSLQHKIFEILGERQWRAHTDDELMSLIEEARVAYEENEKKKIVRSEQAWHSLRRRLLKIARWLLEFEIEQRRRWPNLKTVACEVDFHGVFDEPEKSAAASMKVSGQIDRIDELDGRLILIDYKNRARAQNFSTWRRRHFWQPLLYAYALREGWLGESFATKIGEEAKLAGIFIYDVRGRSKGTGLRLREGNEDLFDFTSRQKGQTEEELEKAFADLEVQVREVSEVLYEGRFKPEPSDPTDCSRCNWRDACRAPHLELS